MSANETYRNSKHIDIFQYCLIISEGMLFRIICFSQRDGYFSSAPSLLVELTASVLLYILFEIVHQPFYMFPHKYGYLLNLLEPKIHFS